MVWKNGYCVSHQSWLTELLSHLKTVEAVKNWRSMRTLQKWFRRPGGKSHPLRASSFQLLRQYLRDFQQITSPTLHLFPGGNHLSWKAWWLHAPIRNMHLSLLRVHVALSIMVFSGYMPNAGIVASYGNSIPSFLSSIHNVLHSDSINLHSHHGVSKVFKGSSTLILNFQWCLELW